MRILGRRERIGCGRGIGGCLRHAIPGESFIRHIGNDKLIFDFKSGNGTTVKDRSRENNDGTFGTGAAAPTWKRNSLYFDGSNYVDLTGISHGISTGEFTFCFNLSNWNDDGYAFDQETSRLVIGTISDKIVFYHIIGFLGVSNTGISSISPIIVQITRNNSDNLESYVNNLIGKKGESDSSDLTYNGISRIKLGSRHPSATMFIIGTMYSFRILNKCLSGIECQNEYLCQKFAGNN